MAQEMRMFTDKLDNLSLIPGNHMVEGKNWYPLIVFWPLHVHAHKIVKCEKKNHVLNYEPKVF